MNMQEATTSTSLTLETEAGTTTSTNGGQHDNPEKTKEEKGTKTVPFLKLFSFADSLNVILMIIGAIGNDICMPLMTVKVLLEFM